MDARTVKDDNIRSGAELLFDLSERVGDGIRVRDIDGDRNQTLLLERVPGPDGDFVSLLLQLVCDGETDVTSGTNDEGGWRHCGKWDVCVVGEVMCWEGGCGCW